MTEDFDCHDFEKTDFDVDPSCEGAPAVWWNQDQREAQRQRIRREEEEWLVMLL